MARPWYFFFLFIVNLNSGSERICEFLECRWQLVRVGPWVLVLKRHNHRASREHFFPTLAKAKPFSISVRHIKLAAQVISVAGRREPGGLGKVILIAKAKGGGSGMSIKTGGIKLLTSE